MDRAFRAIALGGRAAILLGRLSGVATQASTIDLLPGSPGYEVLTAG